MKKHLILLAMLAGFAAQAVAGGNIENGKKLVENAQCGIKCHGTDFNTVVDANAPKLAGQHKDYLEHALVAYRRGDAGNGRNNGTMAGYAKPLSNKDIADIAAYLHSLPGSLVLKR